ncbi:MAG TPA: hypothetical protein VLZ77_10465 [Acidimicrobiales bacterium]|nr:hypothetical protein [Acidimicrobiales bacterium]
MEDGAHDQRTSARVDERLDPQGAPPAYRPHSNGDGRGVHEAQHPSPPGWPVGAHRRREREDWASHLWAMLRTGPLLALVAAAVVATVLGLSGEFFTLRGPTVWTSRTVMLVDEPYGIAVAGDQGLLLKLEGVRLKYQGLAVTNAIDQPVAAKLNVPVSVVEGSAAVVLPPDSLLLDVYGQWSSPAFAQQLSGAVANEISAYVAQEDAQYKVPAADQFTISVVDAPAPATASGPSHSKAATVALGLAIAGFVVGFVVTQLVRNRRLGT